MEFVRRAASPTREASTFNVSPRAGFAYELTATTIDVVEGLLRAVLLQLGARHDCGRREPGWHGAAALSVPRPEWQSLLDGPERTGRVPLDRRVAAGSVGVRWIEPEAAVRRRDVDALRARNRRQGCQAESSYVYKNVRDEWEIDPTSTGSSAYTTPFDDHGRRSRQHAVAPTIRARICSTGPSVAAESRVYQSDGSGIDSRTSTPSSSRSIADFRGKLDVAHLVRLHLVESVPSTRPPDRRPRCARPAARTYNWRPNSATLR